MATTHNTKKKLNSKIINQHWFWLLVRLFLWHFAISSLDECDKNSNVRIVVVVEVTIPKHVRTIQSHRCRRQRHSHVPLCAGCVCVCAPELLGTHATVRLSIKISAIYLAECLGIEITLLNMRCRGDLDRAESVTHSQRRRKKNIRNLLPIFEQLESNIKNKSIDTAH